MVRYFKRQAWHPQIMEEWQLESVVPDVDKVKKETLEQVNKEIPPKVN